MHRGFIYIYDTNPCELWRNSMNKEKITKHTGILQKILNPLLTGALIILPLGLTQNFLIVPLAILYAWLVLDLVPVVVSNTSKKPFKEKEMEITFWAVWFLFPFAALTSDYIWRRKDA